ncbi:sodium:proton antiporter [Pseudoroseomonas deserti]|uniref:Iron-sulfur cluster carrier protein n=1 Tax=Teichococcus deserti TaxID=1817963 RepID=A0A1V2H302_9PROT|nr:Mrp/NBP35 family ATP-binding protein [Pseudoroseomonas deserti]ONG54412.1 sodium:proton antiporter [Pseudoroseomonas deserti]
MSDTLAAAVRQALSGVRDPETGLDVVSNGMLQGLSARDGLVQFALQVPRERARALEPLRAAAEKAAGAVPGVLSATCVLTAHRDVRTGPVQGQHSHDHVPAAGPAGGPAPGTARATRPTPGQGQMLLPDVAAVLAVASGKGGVGKSTTAVNLAVALAASGLSVGLLDADIYGPSLPQMLGTSARPRSSEGRIQPIEAWGLKAMSIGFLVEQETPMIWRGPMVMGALEQMLGQVDWGRLDVLVVDMPPGTGDAQLTMSQRVPLAGAVIVSTPQDVALIDARRGIRMFEKVQVPVLGLIENMSFYCCPQCGHRSEPFGHGGARAEAERMGVEFLGELPLKLEIRELSDAGTPVVGARPDSHEAAAYRQIAARLREKLGQRRPAPAPRFVVE